MPQIRFKTSFSVFAQSLVCIVQMTKKTKWKGGRNEERNEESRVEGEDNNVEDKSLMEAESLRKKVDTLNERQINEGMRMLKVEIPKRIASITNYIQVG